MAVAILISLWLWDEITFNSWYPQHQRLAQVMLTQRTPGETDSGPTIAAPLGEALRSNYGGDLKQVALVSWDNSILVAGTNKKISAKGRWAEQDLPNMLGLHMIKGSADALKDPSSLLLSASVAKALFGDADPIDKLLKLDSRFSMKVGGVYADLPENTTFAGTKMLLSWKNQVNEWIAKSTDWSNHNAQLFVLLGEHADMNTVSEKISRVPTPHITDLQEEIFLHPMDKVYLYNEFENGKPSGGRIQFVWMFAIIGIFVLLLACINFMNLSTARSVKRSKEVGIRKTMGSQRGQLIGQFMVESLMITGLSLLLALLMAQLALPFFNLLAGKQLAIDWYNPWCWAAVLSFTIFTGVLAGSYPAFYLSAFKPVKVLKGVFRAGPLASVPRKVLVVLQFSVSLALIIGTIVIFRQIQYAQNRSAGYKQDGLITVAINSPQLEGHYATIRNRLLTTGAVENMAESSSPVSYFPSNSSLEWPGKDPKLAVYFRRVDMTSEFGTTINWQITAGRDFSASFPTDSQGIILNETAARITGLKDPVGKTVRYNGKAYTIIGITKDMVTQSPFRQMEPSMFFLGGWMGYMTIRVKPTVPLREALARIEKVFTQINPDNPFEYKFIDQEFTLKFANEQRIGYLSWFFAAFAIFISCLGLFGLASFIAEQRTKEIGIRKVVGASVMSLWRLQSKEFMILVFISSCIAIPCAYLLMGSWLQGYEYRTGLSWWIFMAATGGTLVISLLTVSFQALKAAMADPVKSLRVE